MTEQEFANVWDALGDTPEEAANMTMRSHLMIAIQQQVKGWGLTQGEAARRLGLTQPRLSALLRNKIDKFGLDALVLIATRARLNVKLDVAA